MDLAAILVAILDMNHNMIHYCCFQNFRKIFLFLN